MNNVNIPTVETGKKGVQIAVDLKLYSKNAIIASMYRYTDKYYVYQKTSPENDNLVLVTFEAKELPLEENIVKGFCNDLADQQLREITEEKFGRIRDMIVEEAFKPVSK